MFKESYVYALLHKIYVSYNKSLIVVTITKFLEWWGKRISESFLFFILTDTFKTDKVRSFAKRKYALPAWLTESKVFNFLHYLLVETPVEEKEKSTLMTWLLKFIVCIFIVALPIIQFHKLSYEVIFFRSLLLMFLRRERSISKIHCFLLIFYGDFGSVNLFFNHTE